MVIQLTNSIKYYKIYKNTAGYIVVCVDFVH